RPRPGAARRGGADQPRHRRRAARPGRRRGRGAAGNARLPLAALTGAAPLIELRRASVHYGPVRALDALTLAIHAGERVALIGHNGSGKTTLLRVLHGMQRCDGVRHAHAPLRQAMVFQRPFLLRLSVAANMRLALWLARVPRHEHAERALAAL